MDPLGSGRLPFCERNAIEAIVFDCDGVLLDSRRSYYLAYQRVLRDQGVSTTRREIYLREGQPTPKVLESVLAQHGRVLPEDVIRAMVDRRRDYQAEIGKSEFFPGIWSMLGVLRTAGYKLGMVTGSSRRSIDITFNQELKSRLDVIITADDVQFAKPHPQPFLLAAQMLELPARSCLVVENAPYGIQAAKAAGCPTIALCTTLGPEDLAEADWVVPHHQALELLLWSAGADVTGSARERSSRGLGRGNIAHQGNEHGHD